MRTKFSVMLLLLIFFSVSLFGAEAVRPTSTNIADALSVIMDCVSAEVSASYSNHPAQMPSTTIQINQQTGLPFRIAFFLANPNEFVDALGKMLGIQNNFFSAFWSMLQKAQQDSLVSTAYITMSSHSYQGKNYLLNGFVNFEYSPDTTYEDLRNLWINRNSTDTSVTLSIDISILGLYSNLQSFDIKGSFALSLAENERLELVPTDTYTVNGYYLEGGRFLF